jgi:hypothetical protein
MDPVAATRNIRKIVTDDVTNGLLAPEQAMQFYVQIYDNIPWSKLHRKEKKTAKTGGVNGIGFNKRLLRPKVEGPAGDDGYRVSPAFGQVPYTCVRMKLPWEVSEETFTDNIEGAALEDKLMWMLTTQLAIDLEDLHWNGDSTDMSADADFLNMNEGWWKQLVAGAHVIDASLIEGGVISKTHFFAAYKTLPFKYFGSNRVVWAMNPATRIAYVESISNRATGAGDMALLGADAVNKPMGVPIVDVPCLADGKVVLSDPMNFIAVNTWDIRFRKAAEGKSAVMNDMRYYSVFLDDDAIIEELDGAVIIENMTIDLG